MQQALGWLLKGLNCFKLDRISIHIIWPPKACKTLYTLHMIHYIWNFWLIFSPGKYLKVIVWTRRLLFSWSRGSELCSANQTSTKSFANKSVSGVLARNEYPMPNGSILRLQKGENMKNPPKTSFDHIKPNWVFFVFFFSRKPVFFQSLVWGSKISHGMVF